MQSFLPDEYHGIGQQRRKEDDEDLAVVHPYFLGSASGPSAVSRRALSDSMLLPANNSEDLASKMALLDPWTRYELDRETQKSKFHPQINLDESPCLEVALFGKKNMDKEAALLKETTILLAQEQLALGKHNNSKNENKTKSNHQTNRSKSLLTVPSSSSPTASARRTKGVTSTTTTKSNNHNNNKNRSQSLLESPSSSSASTDAFARTGGSSSTPKDVQDMIQKAKTKRKSLLCEVAIRNSYHYKERQTTTPAAAAAAAATTLSSRRRTSADTKLGVPSPPSSSRTPSTKALDNSISSLPGLSDDENDLFDFVEEDDDDQKLFHNSCVF